MSNLAEIASRDARIITLQATLLDHSGHVQRELTAGKRRELVREINALRTANRWPPLDMRGR